ncbi:DEAD/DEAH box helicase family protein [Streptomyces albogriseolus]|uniref:DEAD/DEAH box helicase family protein n=1 Tax=Streptomyces TaxID=1883 RepID=UPI002555DE6E|nr:DEAD/DEAH box helicase family protein [Streptomyces sp. NBRC 14336]
MSQGRGPIDTRVRELAARSANFGFLLPHEPLLVLYGASAEVNLFTDPSITLLKGRQFGETLATALARRSGITVGKDDQANRVHGLARAGFLDEPVRLMFDALRRPVSEAVDTDFALEREALRAVRHCFQLGVWFHRLLTGDREQIPFIPPDAPDWIQTAEPEDTDARAELHALRSELEAARASLELSRVSYSERESSREEALEKARQSASDELARARAALPEVSTLVTSLASEASRLQRGFDEAPPPRKPTASQRELLVSNARRAAQEPLSEARVRDRIDEMLNDAGWSVQDGKGNQNLYAARGVAVREVTTAAGRADYLLYVDTKLIGVIEAKHEGADLATAERQADRYAEGLTARQDLQAWRTPLPYRYVSDGGLVRFRNDLDPDSRTRDVYSFHQPETIARWIREAEADAAAPTYRARIRERLPKLDPAEVAAGRLRPAQFEAVHGLEESLRRGDQRSLIQMATGAGKTYAAVTAAYRLLKHAKAQRILFLVDRNNLGSQALTEFTNYTTPDDGRKFTELYNVDQLTGSTVLDSSKVVISTIQRLSRLVSGQEPGDPDDYSDSSAFEEEERGTATAAAEVTYSRRLPPESFDLIIIDECHRSIYGRWRSVLEYFDAHLVGLTATPVAQTFGFFHQNLISEYTYEQAVADGVAVDYTTYRIRTSITEQGSVIPVETHVPIKNRRTRRRRYEELDDDFSYSANQVGSKVISTGQLRTVLTAFRDSLTVFFPERDNVPADMRMVPKTLVFARDDNHADEIVEMVRDVFGRGNSFCKKITGKASQPDQLLSEFRNAPELRVAVTVDMIATGTDVRAIECVFFLRDVKSWAYFEQMRGRGARVIDSTELRAVTPDIREKTRFVVVDAIGVTESHKRETPVVEQDDAKRTSLRKLLGKTAGGTIDEDEAEELGLRLSRLSRTLTAEDHAEITRLAGEPLDAITGRIATAVDVDHVDRVRQADGAKGVHWMVQQAVQPLAANKDLRDLLTYINTDQRIVYDEVNPDSLLSVGPVEMAQQTVTSWREYLAEHHDEITSIQVALTGHGGRDVRPRAAYQQLKDLASRIARPPHQWTVERLWQAYEQLGAASSEPGIKHGPPDLVSLIRYELGLDTEVRPYRSTVESRFANWVERQRQAGVTFSEDELWWLERIVDTMATSVRFDVADLDRVPFTERGGTDGFLRVFGDDRAEAVLNELDQELTA